MVLSLVNNYENMGGKKQYVEWAKSQGQSINSEDDFFTNPVVKGYYKNHIKVNYLFNYFVFTIFINVILFWGIKLLQDMMGVVWI